MHRMVSDNTHHFAFVMHDLGTHTTHEMRLDLTDSKPSFFPRHRLSRVGWDIIDSKVKELAKFGLVEPATGSYGKEGRRQKLHEPQDVRGLPDTQLRN